MIRIHLLPFSPSRREFLLSTVFSSNSVRHAGDLAGFRSQSINSARYTRNNLNKTARQINRNCTQIVRVQKGSAVFSVVSTLSRRNLRYRFFIANWFGLHLVLTSSAALAG